MQPITFEEFGEHTGTNKFKDKENNASQLSTAIKPPNEGKFREQTSLYSSSKKDTEEANFRRATDVNEQQIENYQWDGVEVPFSVV